MSEQRWTFGVETPNGRRHAEVYVEDGEVMIKPPGCPPFGFPATSEREAREAVRAARATANRVDL